MTRNVKVEFETAVFSMRSALKAALDDPEFHRGTLTEVWRAYLGWLSIYEALPTPKEEPPAYEYLNSPSEGLDFGVVAAGEVPLPGGVGQDVITFS